MARLPRLSYESGCWPISLHTTGYLAAIGLSRILPSIDLEIEVTRGEPSMSPEIESNGLMKLITNTQTNALLLI